MVHDMNSLPQVHLGLEFKRPTVDWSKYIETLSNILIPDLLLVKHGVGRSLLPPGDQVFPMQDGISIN
jgi:hypothetical protein